MKAHTIVVLTDLPLRQVLQKPETSGRLVKWSGEFDTQYRPRSSIKAQVSADFLVKCATTKEKEETVPQPEEAAEPTLFPLYVDGSSKKMKEVKELFDVHPLG